jgi:hypothetical protein
MAGEWEDVKAPASAPAAKGGEWEDVVAKANAPISKEEASTMFGGRQGIVTPNEESGMMMPTPEQLANRELIKKTGMSGSFLDTVANVGRRMLALILMRLAELMIWLVGEHALQNGSRGKSYSRGKS